MGQLSITNQGQLQHGTRAEKVAFVGKQFEAMFVQTLMKQLEENPFAGADGEHLVFGKSPAMKQYKQLLHQGMAEQTAGSLGVADLLMRKLIEDSGGIDHD